MGNTNYSILERNILGSLQTEEAKAAFMWAGSSDRSRFKYKAEEYAREVESVALSLDVLLGAANRIHGAADSVIADLKSYFLTRHQNLRHPKGDAINGN